MKPATLILLCAYSLCLLGGCALAVDGTTQKIQVDSAPVEGVDCTVSNTRGSWPVVTPGDVTIARSQSLLSFVCAKPGWQNSTDYLSSVQTTAALVGTLLLWSVVESVADASSGAGNAYPPSILIQMRPAGQKSTNPL